MTFVDGAPQQAQMSAVSEALAFDDYPRDLTYDEELASLGEDDTFEMANLYPQDTGLPGVVFISSKIAQHGPRVKYYLRRGSDDESYSVSLDREPRVIANSMSKRDLARTAPQVLAWVELNQRELFRFWNDSKFWSVREISDFVEGLEKV